MGLIPCDEAAHIHTNLLLNLEVWGFAKGSRLLAVVIRVSVVCRQYSFPNAK